MTKKNPTALRNTKHPPLLQVDGLCTRFHTDAGVAKAVDGVSFELQKRSVLGIVGESGSGKSVTALSILRLVPNPPGRIEAGRIIFKGRDLLRLPRKQMRKIRGNNIAMVFQEPMSCLNPLFKVGEQVSEVIRLHQRLSRKEAMDLAVENLKIVGIPSPEKRVHDYPHQMSGGMRQRVMIAMALSCQPDLIMADEPTTALDVTIQAQILNLFNDIIERFDTSLILITHDLGVVAETAQEVMVMYCGKVMEFALMEDLFSNPLHPYTIGLMESIPKDEDTDRLKVIPGIVPSPINLPTGCVFSDRCSEVMKRCRMEEPPLFELGESTRCRCWLHAGEGANQTDDA